MYKKITLENDQELTAAINREHDRQDQNIELIASENFVSNNILKASGSILTNKYAEGYPGKRYYSGCEFVDQVENLAIERAKKLFNCKYANVQVHSGSQANTGAYGAVLKPGQRILGMKLSAGGHLTHGYKLSFSGTFYESYSYDVDHTGFINYDEVEKIALKVKPHLIVAGASAYSRIIDWKRFRQIADKVGAYLLVDMAHIAGLIVGGAHPSPFPYADIVTSTTHKTLRGARGGIILSNDEKIAKAIDRWVFPGIQGGPLIQQIAGKAACFKEAMQPEFKTYIQNVVKNSKAFADEFKKLGVEVISGGTDNHLFIIDVKSSFGITGKKAAELLDEVHITANKNTLPRETESPFVTSGVRLGSAAMTTKGLKTDDFRQIARVIVSLFKDTSEANKTKVRADVAKIVSNINW